MVCGSSCSLNFTQCQWLGCLMGHAPKSLFSTTPSLSSNCWSKREEESVLHANATMKVVQTQGWHHWERTYPNLIFKIIFEDKYRHSSMRSGKLSQLIPSICTFKKDRDKKVITIISLMHNVFKVKHKAITFKLSGILILIRIPPPTQQNNVSYT